MDKKITKDLNPARRLQINQIAKRCNEKYNYNIIVSPGENVLIGAFFQSLLFGYSGSVMPGPLLTYTINQSIRTGVRAGILIITGHALLELLTVAAIFLGLGAYLSTLTAQIIIGLAGGVVMMIFGAFMVRDVVKGKAKLDMEQKGKGRSGGLILNGIIISVMNPYFVIWWMAVGLGLIMAAYNAYGVAGVAAVYFGHILADFSWYVLISFLVSRTRKLIKAKAYRIIVSVLALVLIGFGISFIVDAAIKLF